MLWPWVKWLVTWTLRLENLDFVQSTALGFAIGVALVLEVMLVRWLRKLSAQRVLEKAQRGR